MRWILVALAGLPALTTSASALTGRSEPVRESAGLARRTPGTAAIYTTTLTIPTYPYTPCLEQRANGPYPYHWLDWGCYDNPAPLNRDYELLALENDYLLVTLLPELGGRVYQMVYKPTGHNELYQNPVIKPTHWGPPEQGWWLAVGGLELERAGGNRGRGARHLYALPDGRAGRAADQHRRDRRGRAGTGHAPGDGGTSVPLVVAAGDEEDGDMRKLQHTIKAVVYPGDESGYVAECRDRGSHSGTVL